MKIERPKKDARGTFEGLIWKSQTKKEHYQLDIKNAKIVRVKCHGGEWYMYIQHAGITKQVCDLNTDVIQQVKEHCASWFKSALSDELIEDYFSHNIVFDKELGQVIRFKCLNDLSDIEAGVPANIVITMKKIRFFKQKFVLEWDVEEIEVLDPCVIVDIENAAASDDDDIPMPTLEEIHNMKSNILAVLHGKKEELEQQLQMVSLLCERTSGALTLHDLIPVQDEVENL